MTDIKSIIKSCFNNPLFSFILFVLLHSLLHVSRSPCTIYTAEVKSASLCCSPLPARAARALPDNTNKPLIALTIGVLLNTSCLWSYDWSPIFCKSKLQDSYRPSMRPTEFLPTGTILYVRYLTETIFSVPNQKLNIVLVNFHINLACIWYLFNMIYMFIW